MTGEGETPPPAGAVVRTKPPMLFPLVRGGKVDLGRTPKLTDEATDAILVVAVGAATEAAAESIRKFLEERPEGISPDEKKLHEALVKALQESARNPEFIRGVIRAASRWASEQVGRPQTAEAQLQSR